MKTCRDNWERIEKVIEYSRESSVSAFARKIGLNRGENLYQIKRGNNGISRDLANSIVRHFPEISNAWLLTGEGNMLPDYPDPNSILNKVIGIPYYDNFPYKRPPKEPDKILYFSREFVCDAEFATIYRDDALYPDFKTGNLIFLKKWNLDHEPIYGKVYCVITKRFRMFRVIRRFNERQILLTAYNSDKYDNYILNKSDILQLYLIIT